MLGALYAVLSAAAFGLNNASSRRGAISGSGVQSLVISMPLGLLLFLPATMIAGEMDQLSRFSTEQILCLAGGGFMHFVWGRYFNVRSLAAIGSNLAAPVQQSQLLIALVLAIVLLGESLTPLKIVGILMIISGPLIMLERRRAKPEPKAVGADVTEVADAGAQPVFAPRMAEGYFFAFMAAIGFGTSPILVSAGLRGSGLSMLGGLISYVAATIVVLIILALPGQLREARNMDRASMPWFVLAGVAVFVSQMFRYLALAIAPVTVVQPLQSLSLIFRAIFGYLLNREHERIDRRVFFSIGCAFIGALALSISDEVITRHLPLPDALAELATWHWP